MLLACLDSLEKLLMAFPILAALLTGGANQGGTSVVDHSIWQTDFGPMIVASTKGQWFGRYPELEGIILGDVKSGAVNGLWIRPRSDQQCANAAPVPDMQVRKDLQSMYIKVDSRYWGNVSLQVNGDALLGTWNHCGDKAQANRLIGKRICSKQITVKQK